MSGCALNYKTRCSSTPTRMPSQRFNSVGGLLPGGPQLSDVGFRGKYLDVGRLSPNSARLNAIYNQILSSNATTNAVNQDRRMAREAGRSTAPPNWKGPRSVSLPPEPMPPLSNRNYQEARYKTELCLHYREKNSCPHGSRCLFAHGLSELRPYRGRHPKHKTQPCKSFHNTGYCNYGYRCSYIHIESPRTIRYIKTLNLQAQQCRRQRAK